MQYCYISSVAALCVRLTQLILLSAQGTVRGGIEISGSFAYRIEPEACVDINFRSWRVSVTRCTAVYNSWPSSYVDLYAYYQTRRFKAKWPVSVCVWCVCVCVCVVVMR